MSATAMADLAGSVSLPVNRHEPGLGLDEQVVGLPVTERTRGPVSRDPADDQARIPLTKRPRIETKTLHGARCQVLDEHVSPPQQPVEHVLRFGPLHIERQ